MKKYFTMGLLVLVSLFLQACVASIPTLEEALVKMQDEENLTMSVSMDIPELGDMDMTLMMDNGKVYLDMYIVEMYAIEDGETVYTFAKTFGNWEVSEETLNADDITPIDTDTFTADMFEQNGNIYTLKEEFYETILDEQADYLSTFQIEVNLDGMIITMVLAIDEESYETVITISDIGKTKVEIPEEVQALYDQYKAE